MKWIWERIKQWKSSLLGIGSAIVTGVINATLTNGKFTWQIAATGGLTAIVGLLSHDKKK